VLKRFTSYELGGQDEKTVSTFTTYAHGAALADIFKFFHGCRRHFNGPPLQYSIPQSSVFTRRVRPFSVRRPYDGYDDGGGGGGCGEANSLRRTSLTVHINKSIVAALVIVVVCPAPHRYHHAVVSSAVIPFLRLIGTRFFTVGKIR